ncbi:ExeM/NucH family extracellular endonuclease [Nocardioides aquiterrae]|uniref:LTD domain-containing protein n=1 Tax=Nocardioides aquiterrae TaxID=203799 RepID=A0ABP4EXW6_9ACTN
MSVPTRSTRPRRTGLLALVLALVASPVALLAAPAQAVPSTSIVISEIFGGNGAGNLYNQDFIELYNPTSSAVNVNGWSVQYRAATSSSGASSKVDLTGWIPAGSYYLVGGASTAPTTAGTISPDAANTGMNLSGTTGVVILSNQGTLLTNAMIGATSNIDYSRIVDLVGYGSTANVYENAATTSSLAAPAPSNTTSIRRTTADADDNSAEFTTAGSGVADPRSCACVAPKALRITEVYTEGGTDAAGYDHDFVELQNTGSAALPMAGLSLQYRAPDGTVTKLKDLAGSLPAGSYDVLQLGTSGSSGQAVPFDPGYDLSATAPDLGKAGGTLFVAKSATAFDTGAGAIDYGSATGQYVTDLVGWGTASAYETTAADAGNLTGTTSLARAAGGVDTDDNSADLASADLSPNASTVVPVRTIPQIQGTGATTPLNGATVATSGVVTAAYAPGTGNFAGFYLQTAGYDPANDATPGASDGIFVFTGSLPVQAVGKHVDISSAKVSEFRGMTELTVTNAANLTVRDATPAEAVVPATVVPGTDCTITGTSTDCLTGAALEAAREAHEGELFLPADPYTVSDSYDGSPWTQSGSEGFQMKGEIGLAANSATPLMIPTELANPTDDAALHAAIGQFNAAHMITLDDGANVDYSSTTGTAFPWLTGPGHTVRIGADVTFAQPVVLDFRNDLWKLQPRSKVDGGTDGSAQGITIEQDRPATPENVGGNVKIATFNMLNYFVDDAETWVSQGGDAYLGADRKCTYYTDRNGSGASPTFPGRVTANTCTWTDGRGVVPPATPVKDGAPGPRGAAQKCGCADLTDAKADFERQQAKEIRAINTMDADVMSLEEVENAIKLGYADRDRAVTHLVDVLNADWNTNHPGDTNPTPRWAYAPSPRLEAQPTIAEQDAIRSAFIYNPRVVETVGRSEILVNSAPFRNAREPLAQAFKRVGGNRDDGFIVIVNHFKSKGGPTDISTVLGTDNNDKGDGAGYYNGDRIRQARALDAFAQSVSEDKGIPAVFLTGDYNAYSKEDPVLTLEDAGWHELAPDNHQKSYSFGGLMGSLDHVFANDAAVGMVTGQTVWAINANEPVYYEYSRYNYNVTNLYDGTTPFRASDHNPEIIGVNAPLNPPPADVDTVQVLASNDFHGRILDDPGSAAAGAAAMAGAVKGLRADNPDTIFAMAGDIIGASTFESFIAQDQPTLDALNEAGLDVSSAGNHEFDKGYHDLRDRVMSDDGADWPYLAANVRLRADDSYALAPEHTARSYEHSNGATWWKELPDGHTVGFVGAVTEDLPSLVAPSALADVYLTHIVDEVNASAEDLKTDGCGGAPCDLVVMLVHEGAPAPDCSTVLDPGNRFGQIVADVDPTVDAIVSGHTHLKYNCKQDVPGWSGRTVTQRPVVSAGQYGSYLNQLEFDYAPGTDDLLDIRQHVLAMKDYDPDGATQDIVDAAVDNANVQGAVSLGSETGPFQRARRQDPTTSTVVENRGGESTLGNLVAEIQRWRTGAQIAFMNPGGLRADLLGSGSYPSDITYRQAADVQPFANTLMTLDLTGAQIKTVLEQQWQRDPDGNVPSRPFLRLGTSKGFQFAADPNRPEGDRITGMWLDGEPIDASATYHVAATNFLVDGGDNFRGLTAGTHKQDTGFTDLQATVDYLAAHPTVSPDFAQHAVDVVLGTVPDGGFVAGDAVTLDVSSLAMTGDQVQADTQDSTVRVYAGDTPVGPAATVGNALRSVPDDAAGTAHVTFTVPAGVTGPTTTFLLRGDRSGTSFPITIPTRDNRTATTVSAGDVTVAYGQPVDLQVEVAPATATGAVTVKDGGTVLGTVTLAGGAGAFTLPAGSLEPGAHTLTLGYGGDDAHQPSTAAVHVTVDKATPVVEATASPATVDPGQTSTVLVQVSATGVTPTGTVTCSAPGMSDVVATLADGGASCAVGPWSTAGNRTVTVSYGGDARTAAGAAAATVTVAKVAPTVSALAAPSTVTQNTGTSQVTVTVSSAGVTPTGTVTCDDGSPADVTLADGTATCTVGPFDTTGTKTVTLTYSGDANTAAGSTTVAISVTPPGGGGGSQVETTVSGQADPIVWGEDGEVEIRVRSKERTTGVVTLDEAGTPVGSASVARNGKAEIVVPAKALAVGSHTLTLKYSGDAKNKPSSATVSVQVVKADSTTSISVDRYVVKVHQGAVSVTARVRSSAGTPGGSVVFSADGVAVATVPVAADGTANALVGPFDSVGPHLVTVRYTGDANTRASDAGTVVLATKATPAMTVDRSPDVVVRNQTRVVLDVSLTAPGQVVTGDVRVTGSSLGSIQGTLVDGAVTLTLPVFRKDGRVDLSVDYLGNRDNERVSRTVSFVVLRG